MKTLKGAVTEWNGIYGIICGTDGIDYYIHECDLLYPINVGHVVAFDVPFQYCAVRVRPLPILSKDPNARPTLP